MKKNIKELARQYQMVIHWDHKEHLYFASVPAFHNLKVRGRTPEEAAKTGFEAVVLVIDDMLTNDEKLPLSCAGLSGRLSLRLTPDLHAEVWRKAERAGTSINQYIAAQLMRAP